MSDYRRIDPEGLVVQARALEDLAAELAVTARRIDGTLAPVGGGVSTMPIVETARWLDGWASTMTSKAAIAAEAMSVPAAPVLLASGSSPTTAGSTYCPTSPRPATACGCAATASSIPRR